MDILLYTAREFQAGIAIVAVAVAVIVWLVCRMWYERKTETEREWHERVKKTLAEQRDEALEKIERLNATIAQNAEELDEWAGENVKWHSERESLNATIAQNAEELEAKDEDRKGLQGLVNEKAEEIDRLLRTIDEDSTQCLKQGEELFQANQTANEYKKKFAGEKSGHDRLKKAYNKVLREVKRMTGETKQLRAEVKYEENIANNINGQLEEVLTEKAKLKSKLADLQQVLTDSGISKTGVRHKLTAQIVKYGKKFGVRLARKEGKRTVTEWESAGLMVTESAARMKIKKVETATIEIESGE